MFPLRSIWSVGSKRLDSIDDYHRHGFRVQVECKQCCRLVILAPLPILMRCVEKRWSRRLEAVAKRMVCAECGSRRVRLGPAFAR